MARRRCEGWRLTGCLGVMLLGLLLGPVPVALADECPERIDEANALIREAEQALAQRGEVADRAALQAKLKTAKALVEEAETLHNANDHDASVDKAYTAIATAQEVLKTVKP